MIYSRDIHKYDTAYQIQKNYEEAMSFFESVNADMCVVSTQMDGLQMFGLFTEDAKEGLLNSTKEAIKKLGDKILEIIERVRLFISDRIAAWKKEMWNRKSKDQKLREIERKYPKEIADLKIAVDKNLLDFATFKDLNDFYAQIDTVLDNIKKSKIDPKSLRGRWEGIKRKCIENKEFIAIVAGTLIPAVVGVTTCVIKYREYQAAQRRNSLSDQVTSINNQFKTTRAKMLATVEAVKSMERELDPQNQQNAVETLSLLGEISTRMEYLTSGAITKITQADLAINEAFFNSATTLVDQLDAVKTAAFQKAEALRNISRFSET